MTEPATSRPAAERSDMRLALLLTLAPFVALGLARFAYGLQLPAMRNDLGWSYRAAGSVTTANAVGYLLGALATPRALARTSPSRLMILALWATALCLLLNGVSGNYVAIILTRFGAGVTGGLAFVSGGVLAAGLAARGAPRAVMMYPAGAGAGIAFSALTIPPLLGTDDRWPLSWYLLAVATALCASAVGYWWVDHVDPDRSLEPAPVVGTSPLRRTEIAYGMFGLGYIAFVTFVIAYLRNSGTSDRGIIGFWLLLGVSGIAATVVWPRVLDRADRTLVATLLSCASAVAIVVVSSSPLAAGVSAVLFGGSFLAVVSSVTALAKDRLAQPQWAGAIARLTVVFGAGQTVGPVLAGALGDTTAGLRLGLIASSVVLALGAAVAMSDVD